MRYACYQNPDEDANANLMRIFRFYLPHIPSISLGYNSSISTNKEFPNRCCNLFT